MKRNKRAFTLVELSLYMGIFSILLLIFVELFAVLVNRQLESESLSSVQQDSHYILAKLSYDFSQTKGIIVPDAPGTTTDNLTLVIGTANREYFLTSGNLISSENGVINQLNSTNTTITNLSFKRLGTGNEFDVIQIQCDITSKINKQSGVDVTHLSTTLGIREKY